MLFPPSTWLSPLHLYFRHLLPVSSSWQPLFFGTALFSWLSYFCNSSTCEEFIHSLIFFVYLLLHIICFVLNLLLSLIWILYVIVNVSSAGDIYHVDHSSPRSKFESMLTRPIWSVPLAGSMPSLGEFRLTKSMVESRAKRNVIIITFGNYAFMDFITNWVEHLTELNVSNLLVGNFPPLSTWFVCLLFLFLFPAFLDFDENVIITLKEQWIINFWRLCTGKEFQFSTWEAIWTLLTSAGAHQHSIKWEGKKWYW